MEKEHLGTIDEYHLYKPIKIVKRPICDKCGKVCSPAGGIVGEVATLWKCYDCNYEVEDVAYLNLPSLNAPTTKGKLCVVPMSDSPDESANWHWDDEWRESDKTCPKCKDVRMWTAGWYDGTPEDGGACIGTKYQCGNCNHYESW